MASSSESSTQDHGLESALDRISEDYDFVERELLDSSIDEFLNRSRPDIKKRPRQATRAKRLPKSGYLGTGLDFEEVFGFAYSAQGWDQASAEPFLEKVASYRTLGEVELHDALRAVEAGVLAEGVLDGDDGAEGLLTAMSQRQLCVNDEVATRGTEIEHR